MTTLRFPLASIALALVVGGCGSEAGDPGTDGAAIISGALAATDGRTGLLTLTSESPGPAGRGSAPLAPSWNVAATAGTITFTGTVSLSDGTSATLTGSWNTETGALSVTGGGYTFSGTTTSGSLTGEFTGPGIAGVFSLQISEVAGDLAVYCGTFTGRQPEELPQGGPGTAPSNGTWNLVAGASTVSVIGIAGQEGAPFVLQGTRVGDVVTITVPGGAASGTITGSNDEFVAGVYSTATRDEGTFQGSAAACTATSESGTIASLTINAPGLLPGDGRLAFDSTLTFVTARDAAGNYVAAPDLIWDIPAGDPFIRTNGQSTPRGQKWIVLEAPQGAGTGDPPQLVTKTFTVTSRNRPSVSATATVVVHWYW